MGYWLSLHIQNDSGKSWNFLRHGYQLQETVLSSNVLPSTAHSCYTSTPTVSDSPTLTSLTRNCKVLLDAPRAYRSRSTHLLSHTILTISSYELGRESSHR